ncbi:hypothetical protein G7555_000361 [Salmonella enterica subsp. enterica]|nr:hypothetical protein [Salmonella enterica subsp. enterica serovar Offa]
MNNKLTDETLSAWKMEAKISLGETAKDSRDYSHHEAILALVTELQERRKAEGVYCLATLYEIDGVFTKDPTAIANARGRKVQGYVELEVANRFYKGNKD